MTRCFATMLLFVFCAASCKSQQSVRITANLYTDSLKKGFYNYINIEGQFADKSWMPLDSSFLSFHANTGHFKGNDLFIDSSCSAPFVHVIVRAKTNERLCVELMIPIRRRGFDEALLSEEEIIRQRKRKQ